MSLRRQRALGELVKRRDDLLRQRAVRSDPHNLTDDLRRANQAIRDFLAHRRKPQRPESRYRS